MMLFSCVLNILSLSKHLDLQNIKKDMHIMSNLLENSEYSNSPLAQMLIYYTNQNRLIITYHFLSFLFKRKCLLVIFPSKQDSHVGSDFTFNEPLCPSINQP